MIQEERWDARRNSVIVAVLVVVVGAVGAYAYDSSQKDKIADGVTIAGVDVGGLSEDEAAELVQRRLLAPLRHSLRVGYDGEDWELPGQELKVHADIDAAVEEAVADSQDGGFPGRLVRYVTGGRREQEHLAAGHLLQASRQQVRPPRRRGNQPRTAQRQR